MVAIGLLIFAAAVGTATALVVQNHGQSAISVHAFNHTLALQASSLVAAGAAIAVTAVIGLALMRLGAGRTRRLRHELVALRAEYARLTGRPADPEASFFFEAFGDAVSERSDAAPDNADRAA